MTDLKQSAHGFVAEIDARELAVRFMEIGIDLERPPGKSAAEVLTEALTCQDGFARKVAVDFSRMAHAAIAYFSECIEKGQKR